MALSEPLKGNRGNERTTLPCPVEWARHYEGCGPELSLGSSRDEEGASLPTQYR